MKKYRKLNATIICAVLFLSAISIVDAASAADNDVAPLINVSSLELEKGSTDLFGGGDYVAIKLQDARFCVLYGNDTNPNDITIFSNYVRYIGEAIVNHENGTSELRKIPIRTLFGQRLDFMIEVNRTLQNEGVNLSEVYSAPIQIKPIKALDLKNKSWEFSWLDNGTLINETAKRWVFSLSIKNKSYDVVWSNVQINDTVEKVEFTFHIIAELITKTVTLPRYNITIGNGLETDFLGNESYNVSLVAVKFKYDHNITGWDFATDNSKLIVGTHLVIGNAIPLPVAHWLREQFIDTVKAGGRARVDDDEYNEENTPKAPKLLSKSIIEFDDNWQRVGAFRWVSNVSVWTNESSAPVEKTIFFQVHGGERKLWTGAGYVFVGFLLKGAFIYPSGYIIYHDPELEVNALFFTPSVLPSGKALFELLPLQIIKAHLLETAIAIVAVCALVAVLKRKRK